MTLLNRLFRKTRFSRRKEMPSARHSAQVPEAYSRQGLRVVLFIGHHKVGSTSLQDFFARNAVAFAREGVLYPFVDFEGLAHFAAMATGRHKAEEKLPINVREPHNALAFRMLAEYRHGNIPPFHKRLPALPQMLNAIEQQMRFHQPHTVVLAAEVMANFGGTSQELIERLGTFFDGADISITATLRRIDEYIASWHGQRLKFGHRLAPLREDGMEEFLGGIHYDYKLMMDGWIKAMPAARINLRHYRDVLKAGGSVADFVQQNDIQVPVDAASEQRSNESFHRAVYEIVRRANHELERGEARELRNKLLEAGSHLEKLQSSKIELFGAANRRRLVEGFRPIDAYLASVTGQDTFFHDLEDALETLPVPEMEAFEQALPIVRALPGLADKEAIRGFLSSLEP